MFNLRNISSFPIYVQVEQKSIDIKRYAMVSQLVEHFNVVAKLYNVCIACFDCVVCSTCNCMLFFRTPLPALCLQSSPLPIVLQLVHVAVEA